MYEVLLGPLNQLVQEVFHYAFLWHSLFSFPKRGATICLKSNPCFRMGDAQDSGFWYAGMPDFIWTGPSIDLFMVC